MYENRSNTFRRQKWMRTNSFRENRMSNEYCPVGPVARGYSRIAYSERRTIDDVRLFNSVVYRVSATHRFGENEHFT